MADVGKITITLYHRITLSLYHMLTKTMTPFQNKLKLLTHQYVMYTYDIAMQFPKEEIYSSRSQLTRATLSVMLNYAEGYARLRSKVRLSFYETAYGSLTESKYVHYFALQRKWIDKEQYAKAITMAEEIGAMLWSEIGSANDSIEKGF